MAACALSTASGRGARVMSRYFQGLAQRSGLLAPLVSRSSAAGDLVEQDVTTTIEAPSTGNAPMISTPIATDIAQPTVAPVAAAVLSPTATTPPVSRGASTPAVVSAPAPLPTTASAKEITHIVTTEHVSPMSSTSLAAPVDRSVEVADATSAPTLSSAQRSRTSATDPASTVTRIEVSNINTTNIGPEIEESAASGTAPVRATNTTRAHVLPEAEALDHPRSSPASGSVPAVRSTSRTAPPSIDVRIGAIKLDIHQAPPHQRPLVAPVARSEPRRDAPRFAPRRYYLSGW